jgi:hypothetical protein
MCTNAGINSLPTMANSSTGQAQSRIESADQPVSIANGVVRAPFQITAEVTLGSRSTLATKEVTIPSVMLVRDYHAKTTAWS